MFSDFKEGMSRHELCGADETLCAVCLGLLLLDCSAVRNGFVKSSRDLAKQNSAEARSHKGRRNVPLGVSSNDVNDERNFY